MTALEHLEIFRLCFFCREVDILFGPITFILLQVELFVCGNPFIIFEPENYFLLEPKSQPSDFVLISWDSSNSAPRLTL